MISHTTKRFRSELAGLPDHVRRQARAAYRLFVANPWHPGLQFKRIQGTEAAYSVRVGLGYRAVGVRTADRVVWFWIGSHADYDRLIGDL